MPEIDSGSTKNCCLASVGGNRVAKSLILGFHHKHKESFMNIQALFGLSVFMSFVAFGLVTQLYIWPRLRIWSETMRSFHWWCPTRFGSLDSAS
jgi:hypothetical protein